MGVKIRRLTLILAALSLGACNNTAFEQARKAASQTLPYPSSAKFRNVHHGSAGAVCGEMDGMDLHGQRTGYRRFSWSPGSGIFIQGGGVVTGDAERDRLSAQVLDGLLTLGCRW
jgi:hypothetical protein